jgi:hypothetical protein
MLFMANSLRTESLSATCQPLAKPGVIAATVFHFAGQSASSRAVFAGRRARALDPRNIVGRNRFHCTVKPSKGLLCHPEGHVIGLRDVEAFFGFRIAT